MLVNNINQSIVGADLSCPSPIYRPFVVVLISAFNCQRSSIVILSAAKYLVVARDAREAISSASVILSAAKYLLANCKPSV